LVSYLLYAEYPLLILLFQKKYPDFNENDVRSVILACRAQHPQAQKALFKKFFGFGKSICLRYANNGQDAEEMLNDSFMKVFQHLDRYDESQPFQAWFRRILVNTCIDYYRRREKDVVDFDLDRIESPAFDDSVLDVLAAEEILALVQQLPPSYRSAFMLHVVEGYSHREIGELLGINEVTSRTNFMKARTKLQALILTHYPHLNRSSLINSIHEN
jgi:RNA polymerase sigma-70 factor, ECF subfamily